MLRGRRPARVGRPNWFGSAFCGQRGAKALPVICQDAARRGELTHPLSISDRSYVSKTSLDRRGSLVSAGTRAFLSRVQLTSPICPSKTFHPHARPMPLKHRHGFFRTTSTGFEPKLFRQTRSFLFRNHLRTCHRLMGPGRTTCFILRSFPLVNTAETVTCMRMLSVGAQAKPVQGWDSLIRS